MDKAQITSEVAVWEVKAALEAAYLVGTAERTN